MTLRDVILSKKNFRRYCWPIGAYVSNKFDLGFEFTFFGVNAADRQPYTAFYTDDILATDWELMNND